MTAMTSWMRWWRGLAAIRPAVPIRVAGRTALGHAHAVFVIEVEGRRLLVGTGPQATTLLRELPSPGTEWPGGERGGEEDAPDGGGS